jgi:hypothetical protein
VRVGDEQPAGDSLCGMAAILGALRSLIRCALACEPFVFGMGRVEPVTQRSDDSIARGCGVRWRLAASPPSHSPSSAAPPGTLCWENHMSPFSLASVSGIERG